MTTIKWYQSKVTLAGIAVTILGILPIINIFIKVIAPQTAVVVDAVCVMIGGVLTVVWRIWFTNSTISTPPAESPAVTPPQG